jgi:multiple sugar transport system substrate-binding protein
LGITLLVLAVLFSLASCGKKEAAGNGVKVQIMVGFGGGTDESQAPVHQALEKEFNEGVGKERGIEIEFVIVQYAEADQKFTTLVAGGMTPDIVGPIGIMGTAKFMDEWMDIAPYIARDKLDLSIFDATLVNSHKYNINGVQKQVGLPIGFYPSALYYNEDIFDRAGIDYPPAEWGRADWTFEKLYEIARLTTLDNRGRTPNDPGFDADNIVQYGYDGGDWAPWRAFMGKYFDPSGRSVTLGVSDDYKTAQMNSPEWKQAFKDLERQVYRDHIRPRVDPSNNASLYGDNDPLGSNKTAMWEVFSWISYAYEGWDANFKWNVAAVPSLNGHIVSAANSDTFVIPQSAKHHDEAWEVYKWLFSPPVYSRLANNYGCIPAMKSLQANWLEDQRDGVWDDEEDDWAWNQYPRPDINWQVFLDAGAYADNPNNEAWVPNFGKIWDAMENAMANVISGSYTSTDQVAEDLNKEVQGYLDEYWAAR